MATFASYARPQCTFNCDDDKNDAEKDDNDNNGDERSGDERNDDAKSGDLSNLDQLNSEAFKIYNTKALEPCPGCNRTFNCEAL